MGEGWSRLAWHGVSDTLPPENLKPSFEPFYGFKYERKPREFNLTEQEMKAFKVPPHLRDYCAQYYIDKKMCFHKYTPFYGLCKPEIHEYRHCLAEDYILRMKEYERERRLKIREQKKQKEMENSE